MMEPLLSIVIANYNYGRFLEAAILSVVNQQLGDEVELIICDAASTDNSVDIIRKYASSITWWCSEKDGGQSAAFNKGFAHARGKYLTWLNADDVMPEGCLAKILGEMKCHPDCEWFTGNFFRFTQDGRVIEVGWGPHWYPAFLQSPHAPLVIFGPTTFFSKKIYEQVGKIDESLHYIMDNDLWYRFMVAGVKQRRINCFCWGFRMHEESKTAQFGDHVLETRIAEKMRAEKKYLLQKSGYVQSRPLRYFLLMLRIFDGSIFTKFFLQMTFRKVVKP